MIKMEKPDWADVSRETLERLAVFHDLVCKWSPKINLVSKKSIDELWDRHIWDSYQILTSVELKGMAKWTDIGSGGGFPGIVCAIGLGDKLKSLDFALVESDTRKAQFLKACGRELDLNISVKNVRIEQCLIKNSDIVSARALAALPKLIELSQPLLAPSGVLVAMKGSRYSGEIDEAKALWQFQHSVFQSKTDPNASILHITSVDHAKN